MAKGNKSDEMTRIIESENSTILIYFHLDSRILFCAISDADDDIDKLLGAIIKISSRFCKKHMSDIDTFRTTTEKSRFQTFITDIENLTQGGTIAETFPKLLIIENVLKKIKSMGMITEDEFQVALNCSGRNSPLKIARIFNKTRNEINELLRKLEQLDIISL